MSACRPHAFTLVSTSVMASILVLDGNAEDRQTYITYLTADCYLHNSYDIWQADTLNAGLQLWRSHAPNIVLLNCELADGTGLEFLRAIDTATQTCSQSTALESSFPSALPVIVMIQPDAEDVATAAMALGAMDYVVKSQITPLRLQKTVQRVLDQQHLQRQITDLQTWQRRRDIAERASGQIMYEYDLANDLIIWGLSTEHILGYLPQELPTRLAGWFDLIHLEDRDSFQQLTQQCIQQKIPLHGEYRVRHRNGSYIWIADHNQWVMDQNGVSTGVVGTMADISELKQYEAERQTTEQILRERERDFKILVSNVPGAVYRCKHSSEWTGMYISEGITDIVGYPASDFSQTGNRTFSDIIAREDAARINTIVDAATEQRQAFTIEYRLVHADGSLRWVLEKGMPVFNDQGQLLWIDGIIIDISDRKASELALQQSEATSRAVLAAIPDMMFRVGADGVYRGFMTTHREIDVVPQTYNPVGQWMHDFLPPVLAQRQQEALDQALQTGELQVYQQVMQVGEHAQYEEVRVIKCGVDEVLFMVRDITDQTATVNALEESEATNRAIIAAIPDLLIRMDLEGRYHSILAGTGVQIKLPNPNSTQTDLYRVLSLDLAEKRLHYARQAIECGCLQQYEQALEVNGELRYEEVRIMPFNNHEVLVMIRDITDYKQATLALQELNQSLEVKVTERTAALQSSQAELQIINQQLGISNQELARANRLKDEFLATMSHELRTPLNAVLGMSESLLEEVFDPLTPRQIEALQTIDRSGHNLLALINDILDFTSMAAGKLTLQPALNNIGELCQICLNLTQPLAQPKDITLISTIPANLPLLEVDGQRLRQVLVNLLNNAIKFTPESGTVTLDVSIQPQTQPSPLAVQGNGALHDQSVPSAAESPTSSTHWLQFSITDTGIGIAPEQLSHLFQPFTQLDGSLNRQHDGTGLGLAIVSRLIELHGGIVAVSSQLGQGSCFTVKIPLPEPVTVMVQPRGADASGSSRHAAPLILLVEDNEANIATMMAYMEVKGYRIMVARDGLEAIATTRSSHPDLILMDIQMRGMDGLEAIRHIREDPQLNTIPIIAVTALTFPDDRDRCMDAGATRYVAKPVKLKALDQAMQELLNSRPAPVLGASQ